MTTRYAPHHRATSVLILATLGLAVGLALLQQRAAFAATRDVAVGDNTFSPSDLTIEVGDTLRWTYNGFSQHNVQDASGRFASPDFTAGVPYTHTYDAPGDYYFFCKYHGGCSADGACGGQFGKVTVVDPNAQPDPEPSPTATQTSPPPSPSPTATRTTTPPSPTATPSSTPTSAAPTTSPTAAPSPSEVASSDDPDAVATVSPSARPSASTSPSPRASASESAADDDRVALPDGGDDGDGTGMKVVASLLVVASGAAVFGARRTLA